MRPAEVSWVTIVPVAASSAGFDTIQLPVDRPNGLIRKTRSLSWMLTAVTVSGSAAGRKFVWTTRKSPSSPGPVPGR